MDCRKEFFATERSGAFFRRRRREMMEQWKWARSPGWAAVRRGKKETRLMQPIIKRVIYPPKQRSQRRPKRKTEQSGFVVLMDSGKS